MSEENMPMEQEFDLDGALDQAFDKVRNPNKFIEETVPKAEKKEEVKEPEKVEEDSSDEDEPIVEKKEKSADKKADAELKVAFEKLEKSYKDTQKAFHEDIKKLSAYKRAIKSFVEEGTLTDDEAQTLLDHVKFENGTDVEPTSYSYSSSSGEGLGKYSNAISKELEIMERYSSNPQEIKINTQAFQHLFDTSSWQEKQNILDELSGFEDDPIELTKQMLLLGAQHNNEVYSEIHESGGVKQLKEKYINEIETLKKELDKSKKQYNKLKEKYEDYNDPTPVSIPGGSSSSSSSKSDAIDIDAALDYAFRGK